jgi:hypothetical protein
MFLKSSNCHQSSVICRLSSVNCPPPSTTVEDSLQISSFLTNKANFVRRRRIANERKYLLYKGLSNFYPAGGAKNKPNSNPIKPNPRKAQMNVNLTLTKDYRKKDDFAVQKNKPNFQNAKNECKLNFNKGLQKKRLFSTPKNKPNSNPILSAVGGFSKAKMNLKSLAGKSGHTHIFRLLLRGQIHLTKPVLKVKLGDVGSKYKLGIV